MFTTTAGITPTTTKTTLLRFASLNSNPDESSPNRLVVKEEEKEESKTFHSDFVDKIDASGRIDVAELVGIGVWLAALSSFILLNEFVGPWPQELMKAVPGNVWLVLPYLGGTYGNGYLTFAVIPFSFNVFLPYAATGMLFAGGIIMTTCIEWMVASNKDSSALKFWFGKVPVLDAAIVLPGLTMTMIAGTGVSIDHYGGLGKTPGHITNVFWTLVAFATWGALTDLTTQGKAAEAIEEWAEANDASNDSDSAKEIPGIVLFRRISNVVSCMLIVALYGIMTLKPGLYY